MHEMSIVQSLIKLCEKNAQAQNAKEVIKVKIKIGRLSGVEPHLLESAFDIFKLDSVCKNAKLEMNIQDIVAKCKDCLYEGELKKNIFLCPKCQSQNLEITDGEELMLMQLEMI